MVVTLYQTYRKIAYVTDTVLTRSSSSMKPFLATESLGARNIAATATDRAMLMLLGMTACSLKFYNCEY